MTCVRVLSLQSRLVVDLDELLLHRAVEFVYELPFLAVQSSSAIGGGDGVEGEDEAQRVLRRKPYATVGGNQPTGGCSGAEYVQSIVAPQGTALVDHDPSHAGEGLDEQGARKFFLRTLLVQAITVEVTFGGKSPRPLRFMCLCLC